MFDEKDTDYDIVDFEKRFETSVVFDVNSNPEFLAENMKVLKHYGEYQSSEYRERAKIRKKKKKNLKDLREMHAEQIENYIQEKASRANQGQLGQLLEAYNSSSRVVEQDSKRFKKKDSYVDLVTHLAQKDDETSESESESQLRTSRSNMLEFIIDHPKEKNKTVRIQENYQYPKSDLSATCRQRSQNHNSRKRRKKRKFSSNTMKNLDSYSINSINKKFENKKDSYLLEERYRNIDHQYGGGNNFGTMEYKELYEYNQKIEQDLGLLKKEFKNNVKKMIEGKKKESSLREKNKFLEHQVLELRKGYEMLKSTTLADLKTSTEKSEYLEQRVEELMKTNEILQNELDGFKQKTREIFENSDSTKNIILNLQEENDELREKLEFLKKDFDMREENASKIEETIQDLKNSKTQLIMRNEELEEKIKQYEATFEDNSNEFAMDLQIIEKLQEENKVHLTERQVIEKNYSNLESQLTEMNKQYKQDLEESENNIAALLSKISELEVELIETAQREEEFANSCEMLEGANQVLDEKLRKYKKKNKKLKKGYKKLEKKIETAFENQMHQQALLYQYDSYSDPGMSSGTDDNDYEEFLEYKCYK